MKLRIGLFFLWSLLWPQVLWAQGLNVVLSCPVGANDPSTPQNPLVVSNARISALLQSGDTANTFTCQIFVGNQTGRALQGVRFALTVPQTSVALYDPVQLPDGAWMPAGGYSTTPLMSSWSVLAAIPAGFSQGVWSPATRTYTWTQDLSADANATLELRARVQRDLGASLGQDETIRLVTSAPGVSVPTQTNIIREDGHGLSQLHPSFETSGSPTIDPDGGQLNFIMWARGNLWTWQTFVQTMTTVTIDLPYAVRDPATGGYALRADGGFDAGDTNHYALVDYAQLEGRFEDYRSGDVSALRTLIAFGQGAASGPASGPNAGRSFVWSAASQRLTLHTATWWLDTYVHYRTPQLRFKAPMRWGALPGGAAALAGRQLPLRVCYSSQILRRFGAAPQVCMARSYTIAPDADALEPSGLLASTTLGRLDSAPVPSLGADMSVIQFDQSLLTQRSKPMQRLDYFMQLPGDTQRRTRFVEAHYLFGVAPGRRLEIYVSTHPSAYGQAADLRLRDVPATPPDAWVFCGIGVCTRAAVTAAGVDPDAVTEVRFTLRDLEPAGYELANHSYANPLAFKRALRLLWTEDGSSASSVGGASPQSFASMAGASIGADYSAAAVLADGRSVSGVSYAPGLTRLWAEVGQPPRQFLSDAQAGSDNYTWGIGVAPATTNRRVSFACGVVDYSQSYAGLRLPIEFDVILPINFDPLEPTDASRLTVRPYQHIIHRTDFYAGFYNVSARDMSSFDPYVPGSPDPQWSYSWEAASRRLRVTIHALPGGGVELVREQVVGVEIEGLVLPGAAREITIRSPSDGARHCDIKVRSDRDADGVYVSETLSPSTRASAVELPVTSIAPVLSFPGTRAAPATLLAGGELRYELELSNAAYPIAPGDPFASASARETMLYQRITLAGDHPEVEAAGADSRFVEAEPGDASAIWVSTQETPALERASVIEAERAWSRCAVAPDRCDAAALAALGLVPAQVRWVGFALDEVLVTDAAPRGVAPRWGATRVNRPYRAAITVRDAGSASGATLRAQVEVRSLDAAPGSTSAPQLDVAVQGADCLTSAVEVCDGVDNDCDGQVDEGLALGERCEVGQGQCAGAGVLVCVAGAARCVGQPTLPQAERCDGVDNSCDGRIDEGFEEVGSACEVAVDRCVLAGVYVCAAGGGATRCEPLPSPDSDADGVPDVCDCAPQDARRFTSEPGAPGSCIEAEDGCARDGCVDGAGWPGEPVGQEEPEEELWIVQGQSCAAAGGGAAFDGWGVWALLALLWRRRLSARRA